jgi:hypothetical protein
MSAKPQNPSHDHPHPTQAHHPKTNNRQPSPTQHTTVTPDILRRCRQRDEPQPRRTVTPDIPATRLSASRAFHHKSRLQSAASRPIIQRLFSTSGNHPSRINPWLPLYRAYLPPAPPRRRAGESGIHPPFIATVTPDIPRVKLGVRDCPPAPTVTPDILPTRQTLIARPQRYTRHIWHAFLNGRPHRYTGHISPKTAPNERQTSTVTPDIAHRRPLQLYRTYLGRALTLHRTYFYRHTGHTWRANYRYTGHTTTVKPDILALPMLCFFKHLRCGDFVLDFCFRQKTTAG